MYHGPICIYDRRASRIVRIFDGPFGLSKNLDPYFTGYLDLYFIGRETAGAECVQWSADGQMIGVAGAAKPVVAFDFKSGKLIYKGTGNRILDFFFTKDSNLEHASSMCFLEPHA